MKKKINIQLIGIAVMAIVTTMLLMSVVYYELFKKQVQEDLKIDALMLKNTDITSAMDIDTLRVTLISSDGTVLFDNNASVGDMGNHSDRPEVKKAFLHGQGDAIRESGTLNKNTFYYAIRLDDGSVLRVAREARSIFSIFEKSIPVIVCIIIIMIVLSVILAHFLTDNIIKPIEEMTLNIDDYSMLPAYKEMIPLVNTIREQHEDILKSAMMRQDFTANVSHELKTPLTAILGYAELMENGIVKENEIKRFSGEIVKNADRLLYLINDIIKLSELDDMQAAESFEEIDLYEIASACVDTLYVSANMHEVTLSLSGKSIYIQANRDMITELITNLCDNAIRYNNRDGWVNVYVYEEDHKAVLCVKDNGIGISREHQDRIFERFYRVDKSRSKQTGGTGLGLAIVKHIVALHNAEIKLNSTPGVGTEIKVIF